MKKYLSAIPIGIALVLVAVTVTTAVFSGKTSVTKPVQPAVAEAGLDCLQTAKEFVDYPLVFPGTEVEGLPLFSCGRRTTPGYAPAGIPPMDTFVFLYGAPCPASSDHGCPAPIEVFVDPPCAPALAEEAKKEKVKIRGKDVDVEHDGSLRIETKDFKASVYPSFGDYEVSKQKAEKVVEKLQGANDLASDFSAASDLDTKMKGNRVCR